MLMVLYMAFTSAWSGGSLWPSQYLPKWATWFPEALFALGFVYALYPVIGYWSVLAGIWSYIWMQSATAPGLHWGDGNYNPERTSTLKPLADWIAGLFKIHPSTKQYCWIYMGLKGFLIGLPVGGIVTAFLWPLGYEIGHRAGKHAVSEMLAGAGAGIAIVIFRSFYGR
jgi:hypothetical protein